MIALFDTNVLLDLLAARSPFDQAAGAAWSLVVAGQARGVVSAISFNNTYYVVRKASGRDAALGCLQRIRSTFEVVPLDLPLIDEAMAGTISDFEDTLQYRSAVRAGASVIVTRDPSGFQNLDVAVLSPEQFVVTVINLGDGAGSTSGGT